MPKGGRMKKLVTLVVLIATMLFINLVPINLTWAAPNSVTFSVEPSQYHAWKKDEEFAINVTISDVEATERLVGVEFRLRYNDTLLQVTGINEGPFFKQFNQTPTGPATFFKALTEVGIWGPHVLVGILLFPNASGKWPGPMPEGSGTMMQITFKAIYQPIEPVPLASCALELFNATAIDDSRKHLNVQLQDGEYDIPAALYPVPIFTFGPDNETKGLYTIFDASDSHDPDGSIVNYHWDFGDGTAVDTTQPIVTHVYLIEARYDVTLTITDIDNLTASAQQTVIIGQWRQITVNIDAGSVHFAGEIADFYILALHYGRPINVTSVTALLYYEGGLFANMTSSVQQVSTGLYRVAYNIPSDAEFGTYTLLAHVDCNMVEGSNLKSFVISSTLSGFIVDVKGGIATVTNDLAQIKLNLTAINATLYAIRGDIAVINTALGRLETKLDAINTTLVDVKGTVATVNSTLGTLDVKVNAISATITSVNGTVATISSTVGRIEVKLDAINATVTSIDGNVATVDSTLGQFKVTMGEPAQSTTLYITTALAAIAVVLAAVILLLLKKKSTP
jgi:PKD repeat protein